MGLGLRAGGHEELIGLSSRSAVPEGEAPESANDHGRSAGVRQLANDGTRGGVDGGDATVAKVAHQEIATEGAEGRRGDGHAPGCVEEPTGGEALNEGPIQVEDTHVAVARTRGLAQGRGSVLGIGDEELARQNLHVVGRVPGREGGVYQGAGSQVDWSVGRIKNIHGPGGKVGCVDVLGGGGATHGQSRVDRLAGRVVHPAGHDRAAGPATDAAVQGGNNELIPAEAGGAVEGHTRGATHDVAQNGRDGHNHRCGGGPAKAVVDGGGGCALVGYPEICGRAEGEAPGVHQVGIRGDGTDCGLVRYQLCELVGSGHHHYRGGVAGGTAAAGQQKEDRSAGQQAGRESGPRSQGRGG